MERDRFVHSTTMTGFAPATSTVTGWHSDYLSYMAKFQRRVGSRKGMAFAV